MKFWKLKDTVIHKSVTDPKNIREYSNEYLIYNIHFRHPYLKVTGYRRVGVAYVKTFKTLAAFHYVSVSCRTFRVMHLVACMDSFIYKNRHG